MIPMQIPHSFSAEKTILSKNKPQCAKYDGSGQVRGCGRELELPSVLSISAKHQVARFGWLRKQALYPTHLPRTVIFCALTFDFRQDAPFKVQSLGQIPTRICRARRCIIWRRNVSAGRTRSKNQSSSPSLFVSCAIISWIPDSLKARLASPLFDLSA